MANQLADTNGAVHVTREDLVALLNEDLAREYQAVISYVVDSQVIKGPAVHEHCRRTREACRGRAFTRADHSRINAGINREMSLERAIQ